MTETLSPVRRAVLVRATPQRAFAAFTEEIGRWWPLGSHSVGGAGSAGLVLEPGRGGRLVETLRDGRASVWGTVTVWDPPRRVAFTWHPGRDEDEATEVALRFLPEGPATRVEVEHWGWERHPRPEIRDEYENGWPAVLAALRGAVDPEGLPPVYQVLFHRPGPAWQPGVPFREQPDVALHTGFMRDLLADDRLVIGGPFLDPDGGGMAVVDFGTLEIARERAGADPSVAAGLLTVTVRPWMVPMAR